jgi:hypothetical protein
VLPDGLFLFIAGVSLAVYGLEYLRSPKRKIMRALARLATTRVTESRDGQLVKVVGSIEPLQDTTTSPLTGRSCVYYCIIVEEKESRRGWRTILREERGVDFGVRDASGLARVRPSAPEPAQSALLADETREMSAFLQDDERLERFLVARSRPTRGAFLQRHIRAREAILVAGKPLAVAALARWESDADGSAVSYREPAQRLTLATRGDVPLLMSDYPVALGGRVPT